MNKVLIAAALASAWLYAPLSTHTQTDGTVILCAAKDGVMRLSADGSCKHGDMVVHAAAEPDAPQVDLSARVAALESKLAGFDRDARRNSFDDVKSEIGNLRTIVTSLAQQAQTDRDRTASTAELLKRDVQFLMSRVAMLEKWAQSQDNKNTTPQVKNTAPQVDVSERVAALESKLAELDRDARRNSSDAAETKQDNKITTRVQAPFDVVGDGGEVIFRVSDKPQDSGGRVVISPGSADNFALRIRGKGRGEVAVVGQASDVGAGLIAVSDGNGRRAAELNGAAHALFVSNMTNGDDIVALVRGNERGGLIAVMKGQEPIAFFAPSTDHGGGNVSARLNNGGPAFSAGAEAGAGGVCVNRRLGSGEIKGECLGQSLPAVGVGR